MYKQRILSESMYDVKDRIIMHKPAMNATDAMQNPV